MQDTHKTKAQLIEELVELRKKLSEHEPVDTQQQSEELLAVTLRSIGDAVISTDRDGQVTFMNPTAETATGWSLKEAEGKPLDKVFDIRNEETGNRVENPVKRVFREGTVVGLANHTKLLRKDGTELPIADSGAPIRDDAGNIIGAVLVFQDITERRSTEAALRLKNQVFEDSIAALSIANPDGVITEVNPAFLTLWGYGSKEEAIGGSVGSFFVNEADAAPVLEALSTSGRWEGDFQARRADGAKFISRGLATAMKNEQGELIGYQSANLDVTEQANARTELTLRNRIANIFLSVSDDEMYAEVLKIVLEVFESKHGVFGFINEAGDLVVPTMTRGIWDQCQVDEKDIVFPREKWGDSIWPRALLEKTLLHSNERSSRTPKGHIPVDRNIAAPILFWNEAIGLLQVGNKESEYTDDDLRLMKTLTDAIAPVLHRRLQSERDEALRKQAETSLKVKATALERSNKELEQFAYVASHDLQEPLRMVASFTQLLAERYEGKLDAKADSYIGFAVDGARRMQELINNLLTYSRVGSQAKPLEPVQSADVVSETLRGLQRLIDEHHADVQVSLLPAVLADRSQLAQVLQNLISNAVKFCGDRKPRVEISARRAGAQWEFEIKDNGIGIAPEYFERIFVIFQRLHERDAYPGMGMGLSIVKKIVERHGGRVWVESEPGVGSRFLFTLRDAQDWRDQA